MSHIFSIGTAVPAYQHKQTDILEFMIRLFEPSDRDRQRLKILYDRSGIRNRYSVVPDYSLPAEKALLCSDEDPLIQVEATLEQRMQWYHQNALPLSLKAVKDSLPPHFDSKQVTHLITVSCTGLSAPGLDVELMQALDLRKNIYRTSVNFMGCYAAFHALKQADMICKAHPEAIVLVVCVELCTLHFQRKFDDDNIRANLLFSDGAAAALLCSDAMIEKLQPSMVQDQKFKRLKIKNFYSEIAMHGKADMAWQLSQTGFLMTLSAYIPQLIESGIKPLLGNALEAASLAAADISQWAIHPGGRKILEVIGKELQLTSEKMAASYRVLSDYGNMSSATILFVLKEMWKSQLNWMERETVFAAGFGPGLTMETMLLESAS